jgi:MFS family permease
MPHDREPSAAARPIALRMTPAERRATAGLAGIFGLRMLGMFIVLPVLAIYAESLPGGRDHRLVGLALGAYGLTQAVLQIPFGWASDRLGRKPVIVAGLLLFALGSFIAAWAPSIAWTIVGRTVQGAGAISAAVIALVADLTRDAVRTRAMAAIGMTIGATFALSLVVSPALAPLIGVPGIFVMTGVLALAAIAVLEKTAPGDDSRTSRDDSAANWKRALVDRELMRLNYGIFALHAALLALFVQVPFMLRDNGVPASRHALVYLPVLLLSVLLMLPALWHADRPRRAKTIFVGAIAILFVGQAMLAFAGSSLLLTIAALVVFFTAFNLLEAVLPSLVSKFAPPQIKGTAVGVYSSVQFLGTFVGATGGGWLSQWHGPAAVFGFCLGLTALWLAAGASMAAPPVYN